MTPPLRAVVLTVLLALVARADDDDVAPELGLPALDAGEGLTARVDADTGALRLVDVDVRHGGLALVRTRSSADAAPGLFGRGWRTTLDTPAPGIAVVRRAGTIVVFEERDDGASLELSLDAAGRVTRALGFEVDLRYDYDAQGELVRVRDAASGRARDYEVDRGRVVRVAGARGPLLEVTYDAGQTVALATPGGARRFAFWPGGASAEAGAQRWVVEGGRVEQAWGLAPEDVAVTRPDGPGAVVVDTPWGRFGARRDGAGRVREVHGPFGRIALERDARGRRTKVSWPNRVETRVTWGSGASARPLAVVHHASAGRDVLEVRLVRDAAGRVVEVEGPGRSHASLTYAADGTRRFTERDGAVETWTSDGRGRVVAAGDLRLRHDERGRVIEVAGPPGEAGPACVVTYEWDAAGRLVRVVRAAEGAPLEAVEYAWTDEGRLAGRADQGGAARVIEAALVRATLGPGGRLRVDVLDPDDDDHDAPPLCSLEDGAWTFAHDDGAGDVLARSDATGALLPSSGDDAEVDRATGLVLRGDRPYAPALGRFLAPDPTVRGGRAYGDGDRAGLVGALRRR